MGVYATTVTTDLFFRQAVGRFVRWVPGIRDQRAWLYIPDDLRLRIRAAEIAEARRHSLRRTPPRRRRAGAPPGSGRRTSMLGDQLSLFAALSAVAVAGDAYSPWHEPLPDDWSDGADTGIEIELGPPPPVAAMTADGALGHDAARRRRTGCGSRTPRRPRTSPGSRGLSYAAVNLELNRSAGLRRVTEATEEQLQVRLHAARRWQWRLGR